MSRLWRAARISVRRASIEYELKVSGRNAEPPPGARSVGSSAANGLSGAAGSAWLGVFCSSASEAQPCSASTAPATARIFAQARAQALMRGSAREPQARVSRRTCEGSRGCDDQRHGPIRKHGTHVAQR